MDPFRQCIQDAFKRLAEKPGYGERPDQVQLAMLLADCIESGSRALFEAPTGLGKSLATLIPALAAAKHLNKRVVIATYTNVLAEQYWGKDLPLANSLMEYEDGEPPKTQFLVGRQRYVCMLEADKSSRSLFGGPIPPLELGTESELRFRLGMGGRRFSDMWASLAVPAVCAGRACPFYGPCYYYKARRQAAEAGLVITNHSVVLMDGQIKALTDGEADLLGNYDFLIFDEAHDLTQSAFSAFEFEINPGSATMVMSLFNRAESAMRDLIVRDAGVGEMAETGARLTALFEKLPGRLNDLALKIGEGILDVQPPELLENPAVKQRQLPPESIEPLRHLMQETGSAVLDWALAAKKRLLKMELEPQQGKLSAIDTEIAEGAITWVNGFAVGCIKLLNPEPTTVCSWRPDQAALRHEVIDLATPLKDMIWDRVPSACLSATLILDSAFDFFKRQTGAPSEFEEVLPSPFDYAHQAALYVPKPGVIPDPATARREGTEPLYFDALAQQIATIIELCEGRTLALFASRREMQGVYDRMPRLDGLPVLIQKAGGIGALGDQFKRDPHTSLFALRSFWTGFDAPGDTLSCVVLCKIPFEVPIEPSALVRAAWLAAQGLDPFREHSLAQAKMLIRQGGGRLIRTVTDRGVLAILDPRVRTKRFGEEILANLPSEMRTFDDAAEAVAWAGIVG